MLRAWRALPIAVAACALPACVPAPSYGPLPENTHNVDVLYSPTVDAEVIQVGTRVVVKARRKLCDVTERWFDPVPVKGESRSTTVSFDGSKNLKALGIGLGVLGGDAVFLGLGLHASKTSSDHALIAGYASPFAALGLAMLVWYFVGAIDVGSSYSPPQYRLLSENRKEGIPCPRPIPAQHATVSLRLPGGRLRGVGKTDARGELRFDFLDLTPRERGGGKAIVVVGDKDAGTVDLPAEPEEDRGVGEQDAGTVELPAEPEEDRGK